MKPTDPMKKELVSAARAAVAKAFLTKEGGVRYGAAVLTASGRIFSSGQYSSFNHSTNVHAEHGSLVLAAMHGHPDVVMLAVASTAAGITRPCGVCRQVMLEHAARTGRDFLVLMADDAGGHVESTVSALLPDSWASHNSCDAHGGDPRGRRGAPTGGVSMWQHDGVFQPGDQVRLASGELAIVWDGNPWPGAVLVKLKYRPAKEGAWWKFPHAFTEPYAYEREIATTSGLLAAPCGATVASVPPSAIRDVFPALPAADVPVEILECLAKVGIDRENLCSSGSRAVGLSDGNSDHDWVLHADAPRAADFVLAVSECLRDETFGIPEQSGTWGFLARTYPGGISKIVEEGRYGGTFSLGGASHSIMIRPSDSPPPLHGAQPVVLGHAARSGRVCEAGDAHFKRAGFSLALDNGGECRVECYHKVANLVREGDLVAARGWLIEEQGGQRLLQFHSHRDNLVWLRG